MTKDNYYINKKGVLYNRNNLGILAKVRQE